MAIFEMSHRHDFLVFIFLENRNYCIRDSLKKAFPVTVNVRTVEEIVIARAGPRGAVGSASDTRVRGSGLIPGPATYFRFFFR